LAAIAGRGGIGEAVTDVLVRRGDTAVMRNVADNQSAKLSDVGFSALVRRAEGDGDLAEKVGARPDIPAHLFRDLLVRATAVVQQRLLASAKPETQAEIQRVLDKIARELSNSAPARDYSSARRVVLALHQAGKLGETALADFAKDKKFEETVASLSLLCGVPIETADRLMSGDRPDPILILCKAAGYGWTTARAIIVARPGGKGSSSPALDMAVANFEKLSPSTAQRVVRFWQVESFVLGRPPLECQVAGHAAGAFRLGLVARAGKARPRLPPIVRSLRIPGELARAQEPHQRPGGVVRDVGREAEFAGRSQQACNLGDAFVLHEAALPMSAFRPGIGVDQVEAGEARARQPGDQFARVAVMQPDIADLVVLNQRQDLGHAVDERLAADESHARVAQSFGDQVLAAAEADLQPYLIDVIEQSAQIGRRRSRKVDRKLRQQRVEQRGLARTQGMAFASAEEGSCRI
jgi:uncharacterized protein (DUF2336 family)